MNNNVTTIYIRDHADENGVITWDKIKQLINETGGHIILDGCNSVIDTTPQTTSNHDE